MSCALLTGVQHGLRILILEDFEGKKSVGRSAATRHDPNTDAYRYPRWISPRSADGSKGFFDLLPTMTLAQPNRMAHLIHATSAASLMLHNI